MLGCLPNVNASKRFVFLFFPVLSLIHVGTASLSNPFSVNIRDELEDFADQAKVVQSTTTDWVQMQFTFHQVRLN